MGTKGLAIAVMMCLSILSPVAARLRVQQKHTLEVVSTNSTQPATHHSEGLDLALNLFSGNAAAEGTPSLRRVAVIVGFICLAVILVSGGGYGLWMASGPQMRSTIESWAAFLFCFFGLCTSFVLYGIMQEYIMTKEYSYGGHFPSETFLVLCNRVLALVPVSAILLWRRESFFATGCWWCAIPSMTLTISSTCQYSSLRYVSFPTQVTFKSGKIVPTMALGTCVTGTRYGWKDYGMALMITLCVIGFTLSMEDGGSKKEQATTMMGCGLMLIFLVCDALTSNGEKKIYNSYNEMTPFQMMFVMSLFAIVYSAGATFFLTGVSTMFAFLYHNPMCWLHISCLSVFAVSGTLFTFYIIKAYGPVVFSIMMTIRQVFSLMCSAILFGHEMSWLAVLCAATIFLILLGDAIMKHRKQAAKKGKKQKQESAH